MYSKTILIGRLGADADSRFSESGSRVVNLRVATNEYRKGEDGEKTEITDWHRVVVFGRLAGLCADLTKGRLIMVEGKPKNRRFTDREGQERESHQVVADRIEFLSPRAAENAAQAASPAPTPVAAGRPKSEEIDPDDIPF
ncbi:MAG: single-stranded DNA-binding protein [Candidatus Dormibacteria bacterium]